LDGVGAEDGVAEDGDGVGVVTGVPGPEEDLSATYHHGRDQDGYSVEELADGYSDGLTLHHTHTTPSTILTSLHIQCIIAPTGHSLGHIPTGATPTIIPLGGTGPGRG